MHIDYLKYIKLEIKINSCDSSWPLIQILTAIPDSNPLTICLPVWWVIINTFSGDCSIRVSESAIIHYMCAEWGIRSIRKDSTLKLQHILQYVDIFMGYFCSQKVSSNPLLYLTGSLYYIYKSRHGMFCQESRCTAFNWLTGRKHSFQASMAPWTLLKARYRVAYTHQILIHHVSFTQDIGSNIDFVYRSQGFSFSFFYTQFCYKNTSV